MTRQIGEEYWSEWSPPPLMSTETEETRLKYRVVDVVKVYEYGDHGPLVDAEKIEAIEVESRPYTFKWRVQ